MSRPCPNGFRGRAWRSCSTCLSPTPCGSETLAKPLRPPVDPIITSVIQHRLLAIVEEMGEAMLRTSYSQILNSSRDFSTAICDLDGRLIAQAEHVPIHVGALPYAAKAVSEFFGDDIHPDDVFLLNDPYHGGNHLPDLTAFVPVFAGDRPRFWSINRAHQSDIGGATHGAYNAAATDIWQEGIRITPLRLYDRGVDRLGPCRRAPSAYVGGRVRLAGHRCGDRGSARRRRAPDPGGNYPMEG